MAATVNRRPGNAQSILSIFPKTKKALIVSSTIVGIALIIAVAVRLFPENFGMRDSVQQVQQGPVSRQITISQKYTEIKFSPYSWARLDVIDQPIRIMLANGKEFLQYPGKKPQPILDQKTLKLGPEGGLGDEIPGLRIFAKAEGKKDAKLEISEWRKS